MSSASATADLTDDDAVGTHAQRVLHEVARDDLATPFGVRRSRLEANHVLLLQPELGRVLDRDDTLVARDERAQRVQQRGLSGTGTAGDQDVESRLHAAGQQLQHLDRHRAIRDQLLDRQVRAEATDRQHGTVERERRNDRVDARAVGQAGVHHGRRLVDATADAAHDAVDDRHQVRVVAERALHARQLAATLDEDVLGAVDQDVGDGRVAEQRLDRAEAGDLPDDLLDDLLALRLAERRRLLAQEFADREADLMNDLGLVLDLLQRLEVEPLDEPVVEVDLELVDGAELVLVLASRACTCWTTRASTCVPLAPSMERQGCTAALAPPATRLPVSPRRRPTCRSRSACVLRGDP